MILDLIKCVGFCVRIDRRIWQEEVRLWRVYEARVVMIWSYLPCRVKENGTIRCPVEMPSGTWYVDKVVHSLVW